MERGVHADGIGNYLGCFRQFLTCWRKVQGRSAGDPWFGKSYFLSGFS